MRTMMQVTIPVDAGNAAIKDGTLMSTIEKAMTQLKPEAAYFLSSAGERCAIIVFDMADPSEIPGIAEQFFLAFNARVTFNPVMNADDLKRALPGIQRAVAAAGR